MNKLIINLALTGWIPTREMSSEVPLSIDDIVSDACAGVENGATMLHIHARDENGGPSYNPEDYSRIIAGIRACHPLAVITVTTSGRKTSNIDKRTAALRLDGEHKPDMASLTLGSMNFTDGASVNDPNTVQTLAGIMRELGVKPELEVFDLGMINYAKVLIKKGLLEPPYYFNLMLGNIATAQVNMLHLSTMVHELPPDSVWGIAGIGRFQQNANNLAAVIADAVRTGLEDNIWLDDDRTQLASNTKLVQRVVNVAHATGREISNAEETRQRLGLKVS